VLLLASRLHMAIVGGIFAPVGLWWFAWQVHSYSQMN